MYLQPNTLLKGGEYRIVRFINAGGFGNTYEGLDVNLNKRVAIKEFFVKDFCVRDADSTRVTVNVHGKKALIEYLKRKFVDEARAIANMEHENIVDVKALFEENGTAYYVMDYIDGESVLDVLKRRGSLPESEALPIILKVASALGYMHSENRFHLDVKPGNIMLRKKDGRAILIDFGSSKQYAEVDGENTTTLAPSYTPGYAPPEQMNFKSTRYSAATDIYALGATLYKMLTGVTPPSSIDLMSGEETLQPLPGEVSVNVAESVHKAMIPQRNNRLQSVQEFLSIMDNGDDTINEVYLCEDTVNAGLEQTQHVAPPARRVEEKRTKIRKSGTVTTWILAAGSAAVALIAVIAVVMGIRWGKEDVAGGGSTGKDTAAVAQKQEIQTKTFQANGVSFDMCYVEGGTFAMGSNDSEAASIEEPIHDVTLSSYYIGETEVTQALWKAVMDTTSVIPNSLTFGVGGNYPMYNISWDDCQKFIKKLNSMTGEQFHLPTEAEWEFAARGGIHSEGYKYSGSNNLNEVAWYDCGETHPVHTKAPNELGIYDMSGNVCEWCQDWYGEYSSSAQTNPQGPSSGSSRVFRGGCWLSSAGGCRSAFRNYCYPTSPGYLGLRLAL